MGDSAVGKTSLRNNEFSQRYNETYHTTVCNREIRGNIVQFWDTSGSEGYQEFIDYIMEPDLVLVVYDLTNRQSFLKLPHYYEYIDKHLREDILIFLVANKLDLS